jgi:DMSO/TMAO reductase YedYZ molybdopterin-dependent catalytic subunit
MLPMPMRANRPRTGDDRIPPGQYATGKWPVLHAGSVPRTDLATWDLRVLGLVRHPARLSFDELLGLGTREQTSDIHCVTRWSRLDMPWRGVPLRTLIELVEPLASVRFLIAHAEQGYTANLPIEAALADDALVAFEADGEPLTPEHGYPARLMVPSRYFWKSAKWLRGIELTDVDRPGFWEASGYHNDGDPWAEERYGF